MRRVNCELTMFSINEPLICSQLEHFLGQRGNLWMVMPQAQLTPQERQLDGSRWPVAARALRKGRGEERHLAR